MQSFGLLGLLVVMALSVWWFVSSGPVAPAGDSDNESGYGNVLDSAREAADSMEN